MSEDFDCRNCLMPMKLTQARLEKHFSTGTEPDYDDGYYDYHYKCNFCGVKAVVSHETSCPKTTWELPKHVELPTEKQKRTIIFIGIALSIHYEAISKWDASNFISKYLEEAKTASNASDQVDEFDFPDMFPVQF